MKLRLQFLLIPILFLTFQLKGIAQTAQSEINTLKSIESGSVQLIQAIEFQQAISQQPIQLVDIRTASEFAQGHIEGAINVDFYDPNFLQNMQNVVQTNQTLYIYCRSGNRTGMAAKRLAAVGYHVVDLQNGIITWYQAQLPIVQ